MYEACQTDFDGGRLPMRLGGSHLPAIGSADAIAGADGPYRAQVFGLPFFNCAGRAAKVVQRASRCAKSNYASIGTCLSLPFFWDSRACYWRRGDRASACRVSGAE